MLFGRGSVEVVMGFDWIDNEDAMSNMFGQVERSANAGAVAIYKILATAGVYASGLAILIAACMLIINAQSGGEKLSDAKKYVVRVLIVSILIFGVSGFVLMVAEAGI